MVSFWQNSVAKEAEDTYKKALAAGANAFDASTAESVCMIRDCLCDFYQEQSRWKEAEALLKKNIDIHRRIFDQKFIGKYNGGRLVKILREQGKFAEANQVTTQFGPDN